MPGLLRGVARTAVAAGTFTAVSNRVSRHQYNKWAAEDAANAPPQPVYYQQPPPPPPPPPAAGEDRIAKLKDLASLKEQGILTDEEFAREKARLLA
jgi:hypothetical protein